MVKKLTVIDIDEFDDLWVDVIDIQWGSYFTMFLVDEADSDPWNLSETKQIFVAGKKAIKGTICHMS